MKPKPTRRRYSISVRPAAFELIKVAAEVRGWSMAQLVEEATREITKPAEEVKP
jgi:hypothetical protein